MVNFKKFLGIINYTCLTVILLLCFYRRGNANTAEIALETSEKLSADEVSSALSPVYYLMASITIFSLIMALVSSVIAIKFYMWRQTIDLQGALVPEKWAATIKEVSAEVHRQTGQLIELGEIDAKLASFVQSVGQENVKEVRSIKEILLDFRRTLDSKDLEISRLKDGYDYVIVKKMLAQLAVLHEQCLNMALTDQTNKGLQNFEILLRDHLESFGVEIQEPDIGTDFTSIADYVEVRGYTPTNDENAPTGAISEVLSPAYFYRNGDQTSIIRKAKIKYFAVEEAK